MLMIVGLVSIGLVSAAGADSSMRPFKGSLVGEVTFNEVSLTTCPATDVFFGGLSTDSEASGTVSHLGRTTMSSSHCTPAGETIEGGEMTLVAANGDQVSIHYSGYAPFPGEGTEFIDAELDFEIVGGTGRFEGATGGGELWARIAFEGFDDPAWAATWHWDGVIGY
jgi:hypothetical protein